MLNLFKLNSINKTKEIKSSKTLKTTKHFPSSEREWKNSIYVFSKNSLELIPTTTNFAIKMIKSYFSLFNTNIEKKIVKGRLSLRSRRFSSNKIYISNGEFKHTNNKVTITLYLFNRQKHNYLWFIRQLNLNTSLKGKNRKEVKFGEILFKRLESLNIKSLTALNKIYNKKHSLVKALNNNKENIKGHKYLHIYINKFFNKLILVSLKKLQLYIYYRQLMHINRSKLNYTYLQYLKKYLEKLYNKNVEFNLVNLKRFYLNSDILSESITLKLTRNRRKMLQYLNKLKNKIKVQKKKYLLGERLVLNEKNDLNTKIDLSESKYYLNTIIKQLKYKRVTGFRLEAKGRLTKRHTASRSTHKVKYIGNLTEIDSSYRGLSSVLLRGNLRSNTQYTKLKSQTRIGSFGIKGWVSGN